MSDQIVIISESKKEGQHGHSIYVPAFPEAVEGVYLVVGPFDDESRASEAAKRIMPSLGLDEVGLRYGTPDPYGPRA